MKTLLMEIEESVREEVAKGGRRLVPEQVEKFERRYHQLLKAGLEANPPLPESEQTGKKKKRGPPKFRVRARTWWSGWVSTERRC